jgi:hypothetical protein
MRTIAVYDLRESHSLTLITTVIPAKLVPAKAGSGNPDRGGQAQWRTLVGRLAFTRTCHEFLKT